MEILGREAPFPDNLQGRWAEVDEPTFIVIVDGRELIWAGEVVDYKDKTVTTEEDGALWVNLQFDEELDEDDEPIYANFAVEPEGDEATAFSAINGVARLVRAGP